MKLCFLGTQEKNGINGLFTYLNILDYANFSYIIVINNVMSTSGNLLIIVIK